MATFIVLWAVGMKEQGKAEYSITEYQRYWNENERQAYRVQNEFRELWPEFETPNELGQQILKHLDRKLARKNAAKLPSNAAGGCVSDAPPLSVGEAIDLFLGDLARRNRKESTLRTYGLRAEQARRFEQEEVRP